MLEPYKSQGHSTPTRRFGHLAVVALSLGVLLATACSSEDGSPRPSITAPETSSSLPDGGVTLPDVSVTAPDVTAPDVSVTAPDITAPDVSVTLPSTTASPPATDSQINDTETSTTAVDDQGDSSSTWVWLLAAAVLIALIALVVALLARRRSGRATSEAWERSTRLALDEATVARGLLSTTNADDTAERRAASSRQIEAAATALDRAAASAPDDTAAELAGTTAAALRNATFALEAEQLLRGGAAPAGEQLADADQARRIRLAELDDALGRLRTRFAAVPT